MQKKRLRIFISAAAILVLLAGAATYFYAGSSKGAQATSPGGVPQFSKLQQRLLSGFASAEMALSSSPNALSRAATLGNYYPTSDDGCPQNLGSNIKVNQNCLNISDTDLQGRGQSQNETAIAQDPNNPSHIVTGFNDYRRGDGNCGAAYSLNGGQQWTDTTIPMSFTRGPTSPREYWQAGGDPAVAWDTKGNAYYQCQMFNRGLGASANPDLSSAVYVFRSTGNNGASWNFPGHPVIESFDTAGTGTAPFEDKPYMTVDNHKGSPFQDRVYVTWTEFTSVAPFTAFIYESYSADYGETFSKPVLVSTSSTLCPNVVTGDAPNSCDANQFSDPFTGPDGALYVVWANYNNAVTGNDNRNQMLLARSIDGGKTFSAPVKVGDYYDLPDCATYQGGQDAGRACVPEKGSSQHSVFRATNYPSGAVNPRKPNQIVVNYGSYINVHSNESNGCVPAGFSPTTGVNLFTGVKTPGACNNDILISVSNNGGASFTGTTKDPRVMPSITSGYRQRTTDQFWQWTSFSNTGRLAVSYFDRQYGQDEFNGYSDISLTGVDDPYTSFNSTRVTSSSMPFPTQFNAQGNSLFYGDYTGLSASDSVAHPLWMDTRSPDLFLCPGTGAPGVPPSICKLVGPSGIVNNDQDAFTATVGIPG